MFGSGKFSEEGLDTLTFEFKLDYSHLVDEVEEDSDYRKFT